MSNITVYVLLSNNPDYPDSMPMSYQTAVTLRDMNVIVPDQEASDIIMDNETTVTVYAYRKA